MSWSAHLGARMPYCGLYCGPYAYLGIKDRILLLLQLYVLEFVLASNFATVSYTHLTLPTKA